MTLNKVILGLGVAAATTAVSQGAILADWDFSGASGLTADGPAVGTLIAANQNATLGGITSSDLAGSGTLAYEDFNGAVGELNLRNFSGQSGTPGAANATGFLEFTLTAAAGSTLNISDVVISAYRNGGGAAANFQYQVSVDSAAFVNFGSPIAATAGGAGPLGFETLTFDGADIFGANTVAFRFTATNGDGNIHFNDIKVNGVPEPSSTALLGLGGLALILRRRK